MMLLVSENEWRILDVCYHTNNATVPIAYKIGLFSAIKILILAEDSDGAENRYL